MDRAQSPAVWKPWLWLAGASALTAPAIALRFGEFSDEPAVAAALFGIGILGAAFLLAWGAEVAQLDISRSLAFAVLALVAVLPEYAVDLVFAWKAADDPEFAQYAVANMTGANRLLIGIGWSSVVLLYWFRTRRPSVALEGRQAIELTFLLLATGWAFTIFLRSFFLNGTLHPVDSVVLVGLFVGYLVIVSRGGKAEEPEHLIGPPAAIAKLERPRRRAVTALLFLFAAFVIFLSAEPFASNLVESGTTLGVDEFILVQWLAPLASEAPEIIIALIFTLRGLPTLAMAALISSQLNQWSLLVGTLPLVFIINGGSASGLPLDSRQMNEFLLTAANSLFAVVLLVSLFISWRSAAVLLLLFVVQLFFPDQTIRAIFALIYLGLTVVLLGLNGRRRRDTFGLFPRARREIARLRDTGGATTHEQ